MSCLPMFLRVSEGGSARTTLPQRLLRLATGDWRPKPNSALYVDLRGEGKVWSLRHTREDRHWPGGPPTSV